MAAIKLKMPMMSDSQDVTFRGKLRTLKPFSQDTRKLKLLSAVDRFIKEFELLSYTCVLFHESKLRFNGD